MSWFFGILALFLIVGIIIIWWTAVPNWPAIIGQGKTPNRWKYSWWGRFKHKIIKIFKGATSCFHSIN